MKQSRNNKLFLFIIILLIIIACYYYFNNNEHYQETISNIPKPIIIEQSMNEYTLKRTLNDNRSTSADMISVIRAIQNDTNDKTILWDIQKDRNMFEIYINSQLIQNINSTGTDSIIIGYQKSTDNKTFKLYYSINGYEKIKRSDIDPVLDLNHKHTIKFFADFSPKTIAPTTTTTTTLPPTKTTTTTLPPTTTTTSTSPAAATPWDRVGTGCEINGNIFSCTTPPTDLRWGFGREEVRSGNRTWKLKVTGDDRWSALYDMVVGVASPGSAPSMKPGGGGNWLISLENGALYGGRQGRHGLHKNNLFKDDEVIELRLNADTDTGTGSLKFYRNGEEFGPGFKVREGYPVQLPVVLAVGLRYAGQAVTLLEDGPPTTTTTTTTIPPTTTPPLPQ